MSTADAAPIPEVITSLLLHRIKLLVASNETRFLNALTQRLSLRDFEVTPARSAEQMLQLVSEQVFDLALLDLALLDLALPQMLDEGVVRTLAEEHPTMEVVLLSGQVSSEPAKLLLQAGAHQVLHKTAETPELLHVLTQAYRRRVQRRHALTEERLTQLLAPALNESPLSILRKLRSLDAKPVDPRYP